MFGGNGDPFGFGRSPFEVMHGQMRAMDNMMNAMMDDAFSMLDGFGPRMNRPMIGNGVRQPNPFDGMMMPHRNFEPSFFGFGGMMNHMNNLHNQALSDPNSIVVSQSTTMSFDGSGPPRVVQESIRKAGNSKETRRAVRDGDEEHLSVGHTLFDKSHIIERKKDKSGRTKQNQRFINMEEGEAESFNDQFRSHARNFFSGSASDGYSYNNRAIDDGRKGSRKRDTGPSNDSAPIISIPDDDDEIPTISKREKSTKKYNSGPKIQEIIDDETENSNKRRRGIFGN